MGEIHAADGAVVVRLSTIKPEIVRWIDRGRIPLAKVTILDGDPGLGKSTVSLDYAARVSTGRAMPDESRGDLVGPRGVVLLAAEDGLADTVVPRLQAAQADLTRIVVLRGVCREGKIWLPTLGDLAAIKGAIDSVNASLVIIDPLLAYMPGKKDYFKDQHMRQVLAPLADLAESSGAAILGIRHLAKGSGGGVAGQTGKALYAGGGSIGITAAARSVLLVGPDPRDTEGERRLLASVKCNLAQKPAALIYRVMTDHDVARIEWCGTATDQEADELLRQPMDDERATKVAEAVAFLHGILLAGPMASKRLRKEAESSGFSWRTVERAKTTLGVIAEFDGAQWTWALAE